MSRELRLEALSVSLGGRPVLRGVDFAVRRGEVVGLVGPNGAGKTTALRVATGALAPQAGRATLEGRAVSAISRRELAQRIALVPQETHIPFPFRTGELVLMGRAPHQPLLGLENREDLARAKAALERMGIAELADRSVFELSGGERQLAVFARALVQEPDFLLLDEPTAFLDLRHRIEVLRVVRERAARGCGALVVSHDLGLAARACDRLVLLARGVVALEGAPSEVLRAAPLREAFGVHADVVEGPDGAPVVVPRLS